MALPKPNLDDKSFLTIAEEARALIPGNAKTWTDHNVHDPGITFIELFSWLAEMQHYRLNHVSDESYRRFFSLIGLAPKSRRPAEVSVAIDFPGDPYVFVPAGSKIVPISIDDLPFETLEDVIITPVRLRAGELPQSRSALAAVVTHASGREIHQRLADESSSGHYEAFGPRPAIGDSLTLAFNRWFTDEKEIRLSVTLFEDDLPPLPAPADESGFVPSATLKWEYYSQTDWADLKPTADGTLHLSRSGDLVFETPSTAGKLRGSYQIRATLAAGSYEIPPRISTIRTNSVRSRQIETIVNEDLDKGLGTPDQTVRLKKSPVTMETVVNDGPFQIGEVLDWDDLTTRFLKVTNAKSEKQKSDTLISPAEETAIARIAIKLNPQAKDIFKKIQQLAPAGSASDYHTTLLGAFAKLLEDHTLHEAKAFPGITPTADIRDTVGDRGEGCAHPARIRQFNRQLLQYALPDLVVSDRVVIQTWGPVSIPKDMQKTEIGWRSWTQVADFEGSTPDDLHYTLDPETGEVRFGNGFNGKVPETYERIRARFYRHTRADAGNVAAGLTWLLSPTGLRSSLRGTNLAPGQGGARAESIDEARFRSREVFRTPYRAVTAEDYESQALQTPGLRVARAKAIPNHNPQFSGINYPGDVCIVVVPTLVPGEIQPGVTPPSPSTGFLETVRNFLNSRRVVTTNVHLIGPKWIQVSVRARVFLKKGATPEKVRQKLIRDLNQFLNPFEGGRIPGQRSEAVQTNDGLAGATESTGWPFGRAVFPSEICRILANTEEVEFASDVSLSSAASNEPAGQDRRSCRCESSGVANSPTSMPATAGPGQCGSGKLCASDLDDLPSLAAKLKNSEDAVSDYIFGRLRNATRQKLAAWETGSTVPAALRKALRADIDSVLGGLLIWDEDRFAKVELRFETQELLGRNPRGAEAARLNRLLIEDAYPLEFSRNLRLPPTGLPYPGIHELQIIPFEHGGRAPVRQRPRVKGGC